MKWVLSPVCIIGLTLELSAQDVTNPVISNLQVSPQPVVVDMPVTISVNVTDQQLSSVTFQYKKGKQSFGAQVAMSAAGSMYSASIPGTDITKYGVIFKITATDSSGNDTSLISSFPISVTAGSVTMSDSGSPYLQGGFPENQWRMISVPVDLDDKTVARVLSDLGTANPKRWRLFADQSEVSTRTDGIFTLGKSYWLQHRYEFGASISLGTGQIAGSQVAIILQPGWNQIADPYPYPIDWATDTDALSNPLIKGPIKYTGDHYIGIGQVAPQDGTIFTELQPWDGYWVYNASGAVTTLTVNPSRSLSKPSDANRLVYPQELQSGWRINFSAQAGHYSDVYNYIGTAEDASDFEDHYDLPELPVIGDYVSVYFEHSHENGSEYPYTIDYKMTRNRGYSWDMRVESSNHAESVKLKWAGENFPANYHVGIMDVSNNKTVTASDYSFRKKFDHATHFKIFVGTEEFVESQLANTKLELPQSFVLNQNYPNPFNPTTAISYQLPVISRVRLQIYNSLGQEVRGLVSDAIQNPGKYQISWDGHNNAGLAVASGVYIFRLQTDTYSKSRKMLLIK